MLTTLFSISFTSCIDTDVDPAVEAIYAAQADLIAAQTAVQNAEAVYLAAQAAAEQAAADELAAITARYEQMTIIELQEAQADADLAVEQARIAMLLAQAQFEQDLEQIAAAIRTATNLEAAGHAMDYATAMNQLNSLRDDRLTLTKAITSNELFMKSTSTDAEMTWAVYLEGLERDVLAEEAKITASEEYVLRATEYIGDIELMQAAYDAAVAAEAAKQAEIDALVAEKGMKDDPATADNEASGIIGNIDSEYAAFISEYEALESQLNGWKSAVETLEGEIETLTDVTVPALEAAIADYDGVKATLEQAVNDALARVGAKEDDNHASNHAAGFGLLGDLEDKEKEITEKDTEISTLQGEVGPDYTTTPPSAGMTAKTGTKPTDLLWNAELALLDHEAAFAALTATYNTAVTNLASATTTFESVDHDQIISDAGDLVTDMQDDLDNIYQPAYNDAKGDFELAPNGVIWFDGTDAYGNPIFQNDDVAGTGAIAFAEVLTWQQFSGDTDPNKWEPATWSTTYVDAIPADGAPAVTDVYVDWHNKFTTDPFIYTAAKDDANRHFLIQVGQDDFSETTEDLLNVATNDLGVEMTEDTDPFYTVAMDVRTYATDNNTTAWSRLWTAQKNQSEAEYNKANAADLLLIAQKAYDAQKLLFDEGLQTASDLQDAIDTAQGVVDTAEGLVTTAMGEKDDLVEEKDAILAELGYNDYATRAFTKLPLSWDEHANDGLASGSEVFKYRADAGWDSDDDGEVDSLTAYAALWNAQKELDDHMATPLTGTGSYSEQLATALAAVVSKGNLISEYTIFIDTYQGRLDALTAEYEALMATPFYAEQHARLVEINDEIAVLTAEKSVLTAEKDALAVTIAFGDFTTPATTLSSIAGIETAIEAAQLYIDVTGPAELDRLAAAIALGEVSVENLQATIDSQMQELADLDAEIAAKIIEAEGYLALLNEALGN